MLFKLLYYNTENTLSLTSTCLLFCLYVCSHFNSMFQVEFHTHAVFRVLIILHMIILILLTPSISTYDSTRQFNALAVPSFYMCIVHISVLRLRGDKVHSGQRGSPTLKLTELKFVCVARYLLHHFQCII